MTRIGSLFSGYGGLDIGVRSVLGGVVEWHCEMNPQASQVLAHHHPEVPNLGDVTKVDWSTLPPVDVLTGGFPCQDVSTAGKRAGLADGTRSGLWSYMAQAVDVLRPSLVVIENVKGLLSATASSNMEPCAWCMGDDGGEPPLRALGCVLGDLADLGYDARWTTVRASDAGACHRRERVFVVARPADADGARSQGSRDSGSVASTHGRGLFEPGARVPADSAADATRTERRTEESSHLGASGGSTAEPRERTCAVAYPERSGTQIHGCACGQGWCPRGACDPEVLRPDDGSQGADRATSGVAVTADPERIGHRQARGTAEGETRQPSSTADGRDGVSPRVEWGVYEPAIRRWEQRLGRPAPDPTEPGSRGRARLSPAFVEWMMGLPSGYVTAPEIGMSRGAALQMLGNGVVPQQAAMALRLLGVAP